MLANQGFFSKSSRLLNVGQISNIVSRATVIFFVAPCCDCPREHTGSHLSSKPTCAAASLPRFDFAFDPAFHLFGIPLTASERNG
jgi:hypothetical protein